ncbi:inner centromere protein, ARK-binding region protein [Arabidopsis thaliana]|uniref:Inner centromere protein, ARK-binding region protein n=2 Tax=Arabidopsis thaliana TaxID=3702 RepID=A0A1P8BE52_ARATH|nr:inner centromere protein, ARK-binding region protein [Arabidopsis thaliana]ANM69882.1 inner centromere protein, ARK-binding region protein [Arabidopsis thaliana]|eukprot:NP_001331529.1 inner centromere protein, ARK-binding region protein [Arabidopsis thaliana]
MIRDSENKTTTAKVLKDREKRHRMKKSRSSAMFSVKENPRGKTANVKIENLFVQIFERKRRIVEQVQQQVDLYDQHLASKCLLAGVSPPSWLWSPSLPSQTSELNKEEIISELLFPSSRPSIVCPSSRPFSYQRPVRFLADNVVRQDLTSVVNNPLEEQLLEEEPQHNLSHNLVRQVSNHSHEQDVNIASPRDVHEKERLPESVSIDCRENQSCSSPEHSKNQRVETNLDATSPGCSQGEKVPKCVSTTGCKRKSSSLGYCQEEIEPDTCIDPGLSLAKMQRSRSRQKALELRSSAKASKSRSNSRNELKPSPGGDIGFGIASLRSDSVSEIKLFKHDENDEECREEVENSNSQGKRGDQCIKISVPTESFTLHHEVDSVSISSSGDAYASIVPECLLESGHVNDIDILQSIETIDEASGKVDEQVDDPKSRSCYETAYLDGSTRSKSSIQDNSKRKHQKSSNSFSGNFLLTNSNPSHWADHEVELPQAITTTSEVSMVTDAGTSIFQSEIIARSRSNARENRSKTEHSGSVESSSINLEPRDSIPVLQGSHVKDSLNPSSVDAEGLVVENITSSDQSKETGECVDTNRCSSAERVSQTGISPDETTFAGAIQDSISQIELLSFVESSSIELQSRHSVKQSDDESVLLKPVTVNGEALLVEEDNNGESTEISGISKSRSLSQTDITVVLPVVVESILNESGTPEKLIDHSKRCDISCGSKEVQPLGSLTEVGSNQSHGIISRARSSLIEEESANDYKALSDGSNHKSADKQLEVREGNSLLRTPDRPVFVDNFDEVPENSREKSSMEKVPTPAPTARVFDVPSLTDSGVNLSANNEMNDIEDHNGLNIEMVAEMESYASHPGLKVGENEPTESNTFTGHIDALTKRPQHETSSEKAVPPIKRDVTCTEADECHDLESPIQEFFCSSSPMGGSMRQNKRRRILEKPTRRELSSSPGGDILESDYVREAVHHREEAACHNVDNYDVELQKLIGSASSHHYSVELQKMIGSASSAELRFEESYLLKEAGLMSPASLSYRTEQLSVQRSQIAPDHRVGSENINFFPYAGETSHGLASCIVRDSDSSPCLTPLGLISSDDGSPPVLEGFIIQTDDENQSGSKNQLNHDSFQLPRTTAESAAMIEQICKSACMNTPSLHLAKTFKFDEKLDLDQSVSTELFDGMFFSQNLEGSSVFDNLGINHDYTGRSYTDSLPGTGSSAEARNPCMSPTEKLWYRSLQKSSSSEKRSTQTPDLPCISEENENIEEEAENLCTNTPKSMRSEKRGSSIPELPCIAEENENIDEISDAVNEASGSERENVSAERKPLGDVNEDPMKLLPSVSEAKIPADRQSLDSVSTAFSFSAKCNSVKSKVGKLSNRRFTGKGKENQGGAGAKRNVKPPSSRFSKPKLSCNSSLTTVGPRLQEKEPRHNNIVSNITSFVPLVQQQKPAPALITGKRDVKVKALEAAEASKRIAEQKENDRKLKKEAMKLERAKQEQENLKKQEIEKKKKEEDRKKKEAEMAWKQEMEKKKKEEERKRKEFEMADRKRQREEEDKRLKEAKKRQRIADFQRQQREADEKLQAEKELKRQAMDARIKAQKELKEDQNNAEKTRQANSRIPAVRSKSNSSDDTNASRSSRENDFKLCLQVISNPGNMSEEANMGIEEMEESYNISPYKCSDDEDEEEDDNDDMSNKKFAPTWASKSNVRLAVISQQNIDPDVTFPAKSACDISNVLLPRKFQSR